MINQIKERVAEYFPEIQAIRHHIHANPELSFQEFHTAKFISQKLTEFGISHQTGVAGTGIVALIEGKNPDKCCIALRA
ncbi:MAG: amidohydrolase, partial [Bacteroidetes bacterium]|nr:amidohydrolase [Bacteroidota bacterium]